MTMSKDAQFALVLIGLVLVAIAAAMSLCKGIDEGFAPTPGTHEAPPKKGPARR